MMSPRIHLTDFLLFQQMAASLRMFPLQGRKILCRRHDTCSFAFRTLKSPICGFCLIKLLLVMAWLSICFFPMLLLIMLYGFWATVMC
jgi:hypothetical protein